MAVATTYVAYSVTSATGSYWLGLVAAVVGGLLLGAAVERGRDALRRPRRPRSTPSSSRSASCWSSRPCSAWSTATSSAPWPCPFSRHALSWSAAPLLLSPYDLFVFVVGHRGHGGARVVLFTRTAVGLRMRARAFAPQTARLLGVNVSRMLTLGWALAAAVGALAAMLVMPTELGLHPARHGPRLRLRVHRGGRRRAGQPGRCGRRRPARRPRAVATSAATGRRHRA